jgi:uncharacterized protein YjeT (DUF2065 family)
VPAPSNDLVGFLRAGAVPETFLAACALVLVLEGLLPLVAPRAWRDAFRRITDLSDGQLRFIGLICIVVGIVFLVTLYA